MGVYLNVKCQKVKEKKNSVIGFASLLLEDEEGFAFLVNDVYILQDADGKRFLSFPSRRREDNAFFDICYPVNKETRAIITDFVLEEFDRLDEKA